jgi:type IV pilus assembly protein PilQ
VQQGQQGSIIQGKTTDVPQQAAGLGTVTTGLTQTANLSLNVTPIVSNDGSIALQTSLLQEIPQNSQTTLTKDTRSIKTQIILQNGDTAVLGGVFSGQEQDSNTGVPFLRNLPLLGALFSSQQTSIDQNEVLIFITARILNPESAFKQKI